MKQPDGCKRIGPIRSGGTGLIPDQAFGLLVLGEGMHRLKFNNRVGNSKRILRKLTSSFSIMKKVSTVTGTRGPFRIVYGSTVRGLPTVRLSLLTNPEVWGKQNLRKDFHLYGYAFSRWNSIERTTL